MMVTALYDHEFQPLGTTTPPPEHSNQPGPNMRQMEERRMEECTMGERQKIAAATFQEVNLYDEANFQDIELLPTNEEPLYQNAEF